MTMEQATDKQINYAMNLGIENPGSFSKQALKELISQKLGNTPKPMNMPLEAVKPQNFGTSEQSSIIITRAEKPHSYEFGPANNRHKIYYNEIRELLELIAMLKANNLAETNDLENVQ